LLDPPEDRLRVAAGWEHLALLTPEGTFRIRLGASSPLDVELFDEDWQPRVDTEAPFRLHAASLERLAREARWFLDAPAP
jgi:hypothetical protein